MNIAFVTTQTAEGSTVIGRVLPLAQELAKHNTVHVLVHGPAATRPITAQNITLHTIGSDPFIKTAEGKRRLSGMRLMLRMKWNAIFMSFRLWRIKPKVIVIVKSLPENVLAAWLYSWFNRATYILDVDDFELTANKLSSLLQRAAVHWAERIGAKVADSIVTASPFLQDHFQQLAPTKKVTMIPTGMLPTQADTNHSVKAPRLLYIGSVSISSGHRVDLLPAILESVRRSKPNTTLTIAGSGDDIEKLKKQFEQHKLTHAVTWLGRFIPEDISNIVGETQVLIDPVDASIINRAKSSSRILLGSQYGRPIVTSNVGIRPYFIPQLFHDRFFATPGDANSYADKITAMLTTPLTSDEAMSLKKYSEQFEWKYLARQYQTLWNS